MKKEPTMKNILAVSLALMSSAVMAAEISKCVIRQAWPFDQTVAIDYELEGELGERVDIDVKLEDAAGIISVSANSFSGDLSNVAPGVRRIVWDPVKAGYVNVSATSLKVALTARPAASEYLVIGGLGTENVTVETLSEAPDAGFNADQYKKDKIVLKRIRAGRFRMGSPDSEGGRKQNETLHDVILTNDYWIGVFPVTRQQWMHIKKDVTPGNHYYLTGPAIDVSWNDICGENGGLSDTTAVDEGSFLGLLGAKVNQSLPQGYVVALPTEAQWEYACRAGTDTAWNNGTDYNVYDKTADSGSYAGNVFKVDDNLNLLARYVWTTQAVANQNNSTKVGSFQPNAWGLYDCHGNCFEMVFDSIYVEGGGSGPSGVQTEQRVNRYPNYRIVKGGTWNSPAKECRSAARYHIDRSLRDGKYGFRLAIIKEVK
jgi:formylglycine-generating enzyme required for sulfatase activity